MSSKTAKKVRKAVRKGVRSGEIPIQTVNPLPNKGDDKADIIVPVGNMSGDSCDTVQFDSNYEDMTEDYIGTFNHAVTQGMPPINALYAFASAFAIVLGCCIRAGLRQAQVGKLLMMCGRNAAVSSKMVQVLQNQSVGSAVTDVLKAGRRKVN